MVIDAPHDSKVTHKEILAFIKSKKSEAGMKFAANLIRDQYLECAKVEDIQEISFDLNPNVMTPEMEEHITKYHSGNFHLVKCWSCGKWVESVTKEGHSCVLCLTQKFMKENRKK